jgi:hypothetical protein
MSKDELEGARSCPTPLGPAPSRNSIEGMQRGSATQPVGPYHGPAQADPAEGKPEKKGK